MSRNWAFVIGINDYVPTNFPPLRYAKRDAEAVRDFFAQEAGFEGVWLFTDDSPSQVLPNGNELSTRPTVGNLISLLEDRFASPFLEKGDNCWFFFAGHGGQHQNQDFLMPQDANPRVIDRTAIPVNYIRERLCRCGADNVILLLDACRTEGARDGGGVGAEAQPGIITISSCGPTQKSWEIEALEHGAFTYSLLEALRLNGERNCATVERLGQYLRDRVPGLCRQHGKFPEQMPRTAADPAEKLHFILQPRCATLTDIAVLKNDAYRMMFQGDWDLAEQIWIRVLVVAQGRDMEAIRALQQLPELRARGSGTRPDPPKPQPIPQGSRSSPTPRRDEPPFVQPPANGLNLIRFEFETVQVDERGKISQRETRSAEQFVEDLGNGVVLEMVRIPGGEFVMGSPENEEGRDWYKNWREALGNVNVEQQHRVRVPEFFFGKFAVTQEQWKRVAALPKVQRDLEPDPANFKGPKRPIECISWDDAQEFCARLSKATGKTYRLPSEAEWEYACRAGTTTPFYFGETITPDLVNYNGNSTYGKGSKGKYREQTTDVGSFPPNAFGLYDMHGNVWEWCEDEWHDSYEGAPTDGSAWKSLQKGEQSLRLLRGGSWMRGPRNCRSANRDWLDRGRLNRFSGFRVACLPPRT